MPSILSALNKDGQCLCQPFSVSAHLATIWVVTSDKPKLAWLVLIYECVGWLVLRGSLRITYIEFRVRVRTHVYCLV